MFNVSFSIVCRITNTAHPDWLESFPRLPEDHCSILCKKSITTSKDIEGMSRIQTANSYFYDE